MQKNLLKLLWQAALMIQGGDRKDREPELQRGVEAFLENAPFSVERLIPASMKEFLVWPQQTQAVFDRMVSQNECLVHQFEDCCFLRPEPLQQVRRFISRCKLDLGPVIRKPQQPPKGWRYFPVQEAIEEYRDMFGSSLRAKSVYDLAEKAEPRPDTEGQAVWVKLSTLGRLLEVKGNPLEDSDAYTEVVRRLVSRCMRLWYKHTRLSYNFDDKFLAGIKLSPAGLRTWQMLEAESNDDFVVARFGANTGSLYAGRTARRSRISIILSGNQMPQDCVMAGLTIATQPQRLTQEQELSLGCVGNTIYLLWWFRRDQLLFGQWYGGEASENFSTCSLYCS